jgi:hypothetical protein
MYVVEVEAKKNFSASQSAQISPVSEPRDIEGQNLKRA